MRDLNSQFFFALSLSHPMFPRNVTEKTRLVMFRGRRLLQYVFSGSFLRISKKCVIILKFMKPNDAIAIKTRSVRKALERISSRVRGQKLCLEIIFPNEGFESATVFYVKYNVRVRPDYARFVMIRVL